MKQLLILFGLLISTFCYSQVDDWGSEIAIHNATIMDGSVVIIGAGCTPNREYFDYIDMATNAVFDNTYATTIDMDNFSNLPYRLDVADDIGTSTFPYQDVYLTRELLYELRSIREEMEYLRSEVLRLRE